MVKITRELQKKLEKMHYEIIGNHTAKLTAPVWTSAFAPYIIRSRKW